MLKRESWVHIKLLAFIRKNKAQSFPLTSLKCESSKVDSYLMNLHVCVSFMCPMHLSLLLSLSLIFFNLFHKNQCLEGFLIYFYFIYLYSHYPCITIDMLWQLWQWKVLRFRHCTLVYKPVSVFFMNHL